MLNIAFYSRREGKFPNSSSIFAKGGDTISVVKADSVFKVTKSNLEKATVGFIVSALRPEVRTVAVSGWKPDLVQDPNVLDSCKYLALVREVAKLLDFDIPVTQRDNNGVHLPEHHGRFLASHVVREALLSKLVMALSNPRK